MPKREKIQEMFDNIAPEYDRLNHIMSLDVDKTWRKRALTQIFKQTVGEPELKAEGCGMKVLDIACGTGDFSIAIAEEMVRRAKRCHQQGTDPSCCPGHVTGLDLSSGMLEIMGKKVEAKGLRDMISYEVGDCEHLRFDDGAFDRVTVAFGVRNFENREACLKEMLRGFTARDSSSSSYLSSALCRPAHEAVFPRCGKSINPLRNPPTTWAQTASGYL